MDGSGTGLVYRGPFVYRKSSGSNAGSSLTLESAAFGARQYSPALRRWMTPDPLSEKYYGTSPYAFCNNNPVNFVDPDGRMPILVLPAIPFIVEGLKDLFLLRQQHGQYIKLMNMFRRNLNIILNMEINKEEGIEPKENWTAPN